MAALKDWYRRCFKWPIMPGKEGKLVKWLELYYGMCEMAKTALAEYGEKYAEPLFNSNNFIAVEDLPHLNFRARREPSLCLFFDVFHRHFYSFIVAHVH